jgi:hypothetical protein
LAILGQKSLNRFGNTFPVQKIKYSKKNHNQTFPKKETKEDNKVRASTRIQHTHVSKPEKTVR